MSDAGGGLLLVPQFTLAADTSKGLRPGFSRASPPGDAERLFGYMAKRAEKRLPGAQSGRFGAHMRVSLVNDGPGDLLDPRTASRSPGGIGVS